jgi:tetratricopeptide (TPR) repeat protein
MKRFPDQIAANLRYWTARVRPLPETAFASLDPERENLARAVAYGLEQPETWKAAAQLAQRLMAYVEHRGLWRRWVPLFEQALGVCAEDDWEMRGRLACRLGFLYRLDRQLARALELHQRALTCAQHTGDLSEQGMAHLGLADEYWLMKQYAQAIAQAQCARELFTRAGETGPRLRAVFNLLGLCTLEQGKAQDAERHFRAALSPQYGPDLPRKRGQSLINLAHALRVLKRFAEAHPVLEEALALLANTNNVMLWHQAQLALGHLHFAQEDWQAAEAAFLALDSRYLQQFGHLSLLASKANNLGNVYLQQRAYPSAAEHLQHAARCFRELEDEVNLGNTLGDLGEAIWHFGDFAQARFFWEEARTLLEKYPQNAWAQKRAREVREQLARK